MAQRPSIEPGLPGWRDDNGLIKRTRYEWGLTQRQMAEHIGMDPAQYSRFENHKTGTPLANFARVVKLLGLTPTEVYEVVMEFAPGVDA